MKSASLFRLLLALSFFCGVTAFAQTSSPDLSPSADATKPNPPALQEKSNYDDLQIFQLKRYKPFYFILGKPSLKGQISFKAPIWRDSNFYLGYTQLVIWDIFLPSGPIHDVDYNPELFYRHRFTQGSGFRALDFGLLEHESNGLSGRDTRAWNRSYLRWHQENTMSETRPRFIWEFKVWYPYWFDEGTPRSFLNYRGLYEGSVSLANVSRGFFRIEDLNFRFYPGGKSHIDPTHGAQELTMRFKFANQKFRFPFVAQLFHGYAENMLDYRSEQLIVRGGIGF